MPTTSTPPITASTSTSTLSSSTTIPTPIPTPLSQSTINLNQQSFSPLTSSSITSSSLRSTSGVGASSNSGTGPAITTVNKEEPPYQKVLNSIASFLSSKSCYDILPESFRLIVFDNKLSITRSLQALVTNGVVSAPLYDSTTQRFAGMFTLSDVVHLIQYYYLTEKEYENVIEEVEGFQLESLRKIEQALSVPPPPTISVHPDQPLSDACAALVRTHARRLPLVDKDDQTGKETIVSVLTQYRVLKFIAINCQHDCAKLNQSIGSLGIGSYVSWYEPDDLLPSSSTSASTSTTSNPNPNSEDSTSSTLTPLIIPTHSSFPTPSSSSTDAKSTTPSTNTFGTITDKYFPLATATLQTSVFDIVHIFSERGISAVPIVDEEGVVVDLYEVVDIVDLVRQNAYHILDKTIGEALKKRSPDFNGVITCTPKDTLASILSYIRDRRCHRFVIIEGEDVPADSTGRKGRKKGGLVGILSLSDVLRFLVGHEDLKGKEVTGLAVSGLRGEGLSEGVTVG